MNKRDRRRADCVRAARSISNLKQSGGSVLLTRLSPEATRALAKLSKGTTKRQAVEISLLNELDALK